MSEVKWIKLSTSMFEDEKIRLIENMPESDTMLVIWFKLLAQAGKTNASGYIFLNEHIPYTEEMLASLFNRPLNIIRMALSTFVQFEMIEITEDNHLYISNWAKHQNLTGLDKIREDTRKRVAEHRERKKLSNECNVTSNKNVTDKEEEKEEEEEKDINKYIVEIVTYLNDICGTKYKQTSKKTKDLIKARMNQSFTVDDFKRVIDIKASHWLNDTEMNMYLRPSTLFGTKFEEYLNQQMKGDTHGKNQSRKYSDSSQYDDLPF